MKVFYIDLFSGAGGTTSGIHLVGNPDVEVVACVNHDQKAIESHAANHPNCKHYVEDVRNFEVVKKLKKQIDRLRKEFPDCVINIWASLECTNYSKAKGGLPRDADSRTLANALFMYLEEIDPDYLFIENVAEFMAWGPLDEKGKPISRLNGRDYIKWNKTVQGYGYRHDHRMLNSADFGAYTSRERYFGQFAKNGLPIKWPEQTHAKNVSTGELFEPLKKWKPVREVLDLQDEGESIFSRKKPLVEATLSRIYAGLIKFVAGGEESFIKRYNGGDPVHKVHSVNNPIGTISTNGRHAIVKVSFLKKYFSGRPMGKVISIDQPSGAIKTIDSHALVTTMLTSYYGNGNAHNVEEPCPTVTTKDRFSKIETKFFNNYYSSGGIHSSIENPCPVVTAIPKQRLTSVNFLDQQYGNSKPADINSPVGALTANPKFNLIHTKPWLMDTSFNNIGQSIDRPAPVILASRKHHYLLNPSWFGHASPIDKPSPVIIARQDKSPMYLIESEFGDFGIVVYEDDSLMMKKIKEFMALYGIIDIKMRMLKINELLKIQGFPPDYKLIGTQTDQKKFIGNAVEVNTAKNIAMANYDGLIQTVKNVS